ncbi:hypothetical protein [Ruegeria sp. HKCCD8929]|uniref:hypothetical protein n=1 Tax=Ruegeria sp. HKCCD8929 TaxID=2683006 RepID=UPI001C2BBEEE|nr:hypothetical protein [Ruegeria sp. HKCCD8929]
MTRLLFAAGLVALAGPATAEPMEDACLARGTWDAATCTCIQGVANKVLSPEKQEMASAFFARQITSQQIAAQHGAAVAEDFLNSMAIFMSESTATCGAP